MLLESNNQKNSLFYFEKGITQKKQQGNVLVVTTLILLISITVLVVSNSNKSIINSKLNSNIIDKKRATLAADSASLYAWEELKINYDLEKFVKNSNHPGHFDLRLKAEENQAESALRQNTNNQQKTYSDWVDNKSSSSWSWGDPSQHQKMPDKFTLRDIDYQVTDPTNPMNLSAPPQYAMGIYEPIVRKGTEGFYCMPISIIGAAKGGLETTQTLIEINTIPRRACFRNLVK